MLLELPHVHHPRGPLALQSAAPAHAWGETDEGPTFFVVFENGGVVTDPEDQMETARLTLSELTDLRRRRATKDATIHIITSANPTEITWSGTPDQLYEQGAAVMEAIQVRSTCSDLSLAVTVRARRSAALRVGPIVSTTG